MNGNVLLAQAKAKGPPGAGMMASSSVGPENEPASPRLAMSIDLGAEYLKMALAKGIGSSAGPSVEIVRNRWRKSRTTPLAVHIRQRDMFFGWEALEKAVDEPWHTHTFFLDLVAKKFGDPVMENYWHRFPHLNLRQNLLQGTVSFMTDAGEIPVETMLAMVLANARSEVEAYAGQPVKDAVIAVPAHFGPGERQAVETAARIAGLNPLQLLSAGAAAALNYGVFRYKDITQEPQTVLIYDFGSTKVQATVVQYSGQNGPSTKKADGQMAKLAVLGFGSDARLCGHFLTLRVRDQLLEQFKQQHPDKGTGSNAITSCPKAMARLLREADRMKQHIFSPGPGQVLLHPRGWPRVDVQGPKMTKLFLGHDFQPLLPNAPQILRPLLDALLEPMKMALEMAGIGVEQVDKLLVIGASSRIEPVQMALKQYFKGIVPMEEDALDPVEAIALGAALKAALLLLPQKSLHLVDWPVFGEQQNGLELGPDKSEELAKPPEEEEREEEANNLASKRRRTSTTTNSPQPKGKKKMATRA